MSLNEFVLAWGLYLLATVGCLVPFWKLTALLAPEKKSWTRMLVSTALLTPGVPAAGSDWSAPVLLGSFYGLLGQNSEAVGNVLELVIVLGAVSLLRVWRLKQAQQAQTLS